MLKTFDNLGREKRVTDLPAGSVDGDALADELAVALGITDSEGVRRGKSIIATEQARSNTAYGLLTTPDVVEDVVLPADGLIVVAYQALWKESVQGAAKAALFVGASQLKARVTDSAAPQVTEAAVGSGGLGQYTGLASHALGLAGGDPSVAATPDVTTGQVVGIHYAGAAGAFSITEGATMVQPFGGLCYIFAAAGTYDVSVQFKASSGSVTAKERKLWVWTLGF